MEVTATDAALKDELINLGLEERALESVVAQYDYISKDQMNTLISIKYRISQLVEVLKVGPRP